MEPQKHTGTQAHGGEQHVFPPFNTATFPSQLLWLALSFGLLYVLMSRVALPRLTAIFEARRNRIVSDLDEAQRLKDETESAVSSYEKALRDARERAAKIAQDMRDKLNAETDATRAKVERDLQAKITDAETRIAAARSKVMGEVESIAHDTAEAIVIKLIGSSNGENGLSGAVKTALKRAG